MKTSINALASKPGKLLVEFSGAGEMLAYLNTTDARRKTGDDMYRGNSFYGGVTWDDLDRLVVEGDKDVADRAKALLAKINAATPATIKRQRVSRPFGRAVTGAYLSNDPMPCRARVKVKTDNAPLTIAVNVASSGMTSARDLEKRGIAIAALVQKVSVSRPVKLSLVGAAQCYGSSSVAWSCDFPTRPLDAYRLAWLLSNQAFARGMGFACYRSASNLYALAGSSAKPCHYTDSIKWFENSQTYSNDRGPATLGDDLSKHWRGEVFYIPSAGCDGNNYYKMLQDPVAWINENVTALSK